MPWSFGTLETTIGVKYTYISTTEDNQEFTLQNSDTDYHVFLSNSSLQKGRKCYQFSWLSGTQTYEVGFQTSNYYIFFTPTSFTLRGFKESDIVYFLNYSIVPSLSYLACLDTIHMKFSIVNETDYFSVSIPEEATGRQWVIRANNNKRSSSNQFAAYIKMSFGESIPFVPPHFFRWNSTRNYDQEIVCTQTKLFSFPKLLFTTIIINKLT